MPWAGGVYTRGYPSWTNDANNSLPISASKFDTSDNDFASGLNNTITKDGLSVPTSTLNWTVQMNWSRGSDGNIWSLARTGGSNNPKLQGSVTDASGVTLAATGGAFIQTASGSINLTGGTGLVATATTGVLSLLASAGTVTLNGTAIQGQGPVAGALVDMTPDKGSWSATLTGPYTINPSGTLKWERQGTQVTVWCDANIFGTATSSNVISVVGIPAAITPSSLRVVVAAFLTDGGGNLFGSVQISSGGAFSIGVAKTLGGANPVEIGGGNNFNGSGSTGIPAGFSITYSL